MNISHVHFHVHFHMKKVISDAVGWQQSLFSWRSSASDFIIGIFFSVVISLWPVLKGFAHECVFLCGSWPSGRIRVVYSELLIGHEKGTLIGLFFWRSDAKCTKH